MVDLKIINALDSVTYIASFDAFELYMGDEKSSTTSLMNVGILHYIYDRGVLLFTCTITHSC